MRTKHARAASVAAAVIGAVLLATPARAATAADWTGGPADGPEWTGGPHDTGTNALDTNGVADGTGGRPAPESGIATYMVPLEPA